MRRTRRFLIGFTVLFVAFAWLAVASWLQPGGAWWVPVTFGACAVVSAGNLAAWTTKYRRGRSPGTP